MPIAVVGVSHETAPISVREELALTLDEQADGLLAVRADSEVAEAVILSTCNRAEVYVHPTFTDSSVEAVYRFLASKAGSSVGTVSKYLFLERDERAVRHLFQVSSGLNSLVFGEAEIQGQVRDAYQRASTLPVNPPMTGPVMNRLFQMALAVGGRVRAETSIGEGAASVASVAVELARTTLGCLTGKRPLLLGTGETGDLIAAALAREGVGGFLVANRTRLHAEGLARKYSGRAIPLEELPLELGGVDLVLTSTSSAEPLLSREDVREACVKRTGDPLLIIDLGVPRDVEPSVGEEPGVVLHHIDDLERIMQKRVSAREVALPQAEAIITRHVESFRTWYSSRRVAGLIREIRTQGDAVRRAELTRVLRGLRHLAPEDRGRIERFARRLQNKLLHRPIARLRKGSDGRRARELVDVVRFLYEVDSPELEAIEDGR